jgi:hypothetical protein
MVKAVFAVNNVNCYNVVHEAWVARVEGEDEEELLKGTKRASECDNKIEALVAMSVSRKDGTKIQTLPYKKEGEEIVFLENELDEFDGVEGTFTELLVPEGYPIPEPIKAISSEIIRNFGKLVPIKNVH